MNIARCIKSTLIKWTVKYTLQKELALDDEVSAFCERDFPPAVFLAGQVYLIF